MANCDHVKQLQQCWVLFTVDVMSYNSCTVMSMSMPVFVGLT